MYGSFGAVELGDLHAFRTPVDLGLSQAVLSNLDLSLDHCIPKEITTAAMPNQISTEADGLSDLLI